ncbi:MAG: DUF6263 family protein [Ignavibacteriaceae bacterium]
MKYLLSLFFLALLFIGCGEDTKKEPVADEKNKFVFDSTDIKTTNADNPDEAFELRYNFFKGEKYNYRLSVISRDNQTIKTDTTMSQSVTQNLIYLLSLTGKDVDNEGIMELECNITSIRLDAQAGERSFSYESGKADSADKKTYSDYEMLVNNPFSIRISKTGDIIEVFRVDRILNKFLDLKGYTDSVTAEQKNVLRRDLSEGTIKQLMSLIFREVPEHTVAKDSVWSKTQPEAQLLIFKMKNTNTYKIENLEMLEDDKIAVIDAGISTNLTGNPRFTDQGREYEFQKPVTKADGKIFFNISDGLVQKSKTTTIVNISFVVEGNTPQGRQKINQAQTVENTNILERL